MPSLGGIKVDSRPPGKTPLRLWLQVNGISRYAFAEKIGCHHKLVERWASGKSIPHLVYAFKIERATEGAVPASSWLGTDIGKAFWNTMGYDWARYHRKRAAREGYRTRKGRKK